MAKKLISQDNVLAIIGPNASGNAIPAARICEDAKVIMITPWSTNPKTTENKKFVFRACFMDDFQGQVMAKFARDNLKAKTAAVLYDMASEYNKGIAEFFKKSFEDMGGKVVAFESYTKDDKDFSSQLTNIKAARPGRALPPQLLQRSAPAGAAGPAPGDHLPSSSAPTPGAARKS